MVILKLLNNCLLMEIFYEFFKKIFNTSSDFVSFLVLK